MAYSASALQLTHVLQQLYRRLGAVVTTATDGSTTLAVDTKLAEQLGEGNVDDFLNGGVLIVVKSTDGAAPEGEAAPISDYDSNQTAITLSPALTTAIQAGDKFLFIGSDFPLYDMVEVVNDGLRYLDEIPVPDFSLTTIANQTEYLLPLAMAGKQLLDVEVQTNLTDPDDNGFVPVEGWGIVAGDFPGNQSTLVIPQLTAGYNLRLTYLGIHPKVSAYDDFISPYLHPDLVHAVVFAHAVQWKNDQNAVQGSADQALLGLEQKAWSQVDRARLLHKVVVPPRRIQGMPHFNPSPGTRYGLYPPYSSYG